MPTIVMHALPALDWVRADAVGDRSDRSLLRQLLSEVLDLRRRIGKGANIEAERMRYTSCIGELESRLSRSGTHASRDALERKLRAGDACAFELPPAYFDLMTRAHLERMESRATLQLVAETGVVAELGASIYPPSSLIAHAAELDRFAAGLMLADQPTLQKIARERADLVRTLHALGAGFVEASEELDNRDVVPPPPRTLSPEARARIAAWDQPPPATTANGRRRMAERLEHEIEAALRGGSAVNMSNQPHEVSTEVLARFLFAAGDQSGGQVRVVYADGSEARPFPLRSLPPPAAAPDGAVEIAVALMSMRHLELDPLVDWAWFRNKEVSQTRQLAESDEFCFRYSLDQLEGLRAAYGGRRVRLSMYHTGFEPAALGFYRALALSLRAQRGWLRVVPHFFRGGTRFEASQMAWE